MTEVKQLDSASTSARRVRERHLLLSGVTSGVGRRAREAFSDIPIPALLIFAAVTIFDFLTFQHPDLLVTDDASYGYLFGHVTDFYDYNNAVLHGPLDYLPTLYIIFAAFMWPVKFAVSGREQHLLFLSNYELAWARFVLLCFFLATFYVVHLITRELFPGRPQAQRNVRIAFLLAPIASFGFNIFGQYDIIGVFFAMLGVLYYLRGDKWKFALFFSLAISCKYFAALVFVPLVVLRYKRIREIVPVLLGGAAITLIEWAVYFHNYSFHHHTMFGLVGGKTTGAESQAISHLVVVVYVVGVFLLWRYRPQSDETSKMLTVYAPVVAYGCMFAAVVWHPQWWIILTPFTALSIGFLRRAWLFYLWDSIGFLIFIWLVVDGWPGSVDVQLSEGGLLKTVMPTPKFSLSAIYSSDHINVIQTLELAYLASPVIFLIGERILRVLPDRPDPRLPAFAIWVRALTIPVFWIVPCLLAWFLPTRLAVHIDESAAIAGLTPAQLCTKGSSTVVGGFSDGSRVTQTFTSSLSQVSGISIPVGTYHRKSRGQLQAQILDPSGAVLATTTRALSTVRDNASAALTFSAIRDANGKKLTLVLTTSGTPANKGVALYAFQNDCAPGDTTTVNGAPAKGDMALTYYGK